MNRQTRRLLQKQGDMNAQGASTSTRERSRPTQQKEKRTSPVEFLSEVRGELRRVVWPTRAELINYSIVVLITILVLTAIVGGLDWLFGEAVLRIYDTNR